jgi:phosphoribosyl 1,2-cyclic phosphodiesterase
MDFRPLASSSSGNCFILSDNGDQIMIEAGLHWHRVKELLDFRTNEIRACLVTHGHNDHAGHVRSVMRAGIDVYASVETLLQHDPQGRWCHRSYTVLPLEQFQIGTWAVKPFRTEHDCPGALGFLIQKGDERLLFATDTFYIKFKFERLTAIAIECNWSEETLDPEIHPARYKRLLTSHFSLKHVKAFLRLNDLSRVTQIHLIHISRDNGDPDFFQKEIQELTGIPTFAIGAKGNGTTI